MDTVAQGATYSDVVIIKDVSGVLVTNGLAGTPSVTLTTLRDALGVDRRTGASLSYDGDGGYRLSKPIPSDGALGSWWGVVTYNDNAGFFRTFPFAFTVVTAAQANPVAAITSLAVGGAAGTWGAALANVGPATLSIAQLPLVNTNGAIVWVREVP